jgi:hypothetical protein
MRSAITTAFALLMGLVATGVDAEYPDWEQALDVKVIEVLTRDEDGDQRATKVWFVMLDGAPYLRTNGSKWLANLRRDPNLGLRIDDREYEARAEEIPGDDIVERVDRASVEKYGWQERFIHVFRMKKPDILRISSRRDPS